jgi:RND family efflux transporter MFP subunit
LSEPQASFASRPDLRVAQGSWRSQPRNLGSPSFWLLFLGEARKSTPASKADPKPDKGKAPAFTNWQKIPTLGIHAIAWGPNLIEQLNQAMLIYMKKPLIFSLFALLTVGLAPTAIAAAASAQSLAVVIVQRHLVDLTFPAESLVEAVQQAIVGAQVAGRVLEVKVDAGQVVKKGDLLMRIDAREAEEIARAAAAQYANAKLNYERTKTLKDQRFLSPAAVDKAKADFDSAAANRSAAGASQSHATIVSPINGIVARRHAELGDMATPGKPLFTIYEPGSLRVTASVPQYRLQDMRNVKTARVEFPELGKWVEATAVNLLPTADATTHVSQVRVSLPVLPEATPGMFARVHFVVGQAEKLTVPATAVVRRGEVAAVYVQSANSRLSLRQLRLGDAVGEGEIEVLAGLAAGDKVVTDPVKAAIELKQNSNK